MQITEDEFLSNIAALREAAALQGGRLSQAQIDEQFGSLTQEQRELLLAYFKENHVGVDEELPEETLLSSDERKHLGYYLEELSELEEIGAGEKEALVKNAMRGDADAAARVMQSYLRSIVDIARLYTGQGVEIADLIGEGNVALATAMGEVEKLQDAAECDQMVVRAVMRSMEALIGQEEEQTEGKQRMLYKVVRVGDKARALSDALRRAVSVAELVDYTAEEEDEGDRISEEDIREAMRYASGLAKYIAL